MRYLIPVFAMLAPMALASVASAQEPGDGDVLFQENCAVCHGRDARGSGPMTPALTTVPPDLTGLALRNDGVFPAADIVRWIDGRDLVPSHGGPMPLFGRLLEGESAVVDAPDGTPVFTTRGVLDIVTWLSEIQVD